VRPAVVIVITYLVGSIPFGYLIVRATQGADVRETGSGGTGATNVSRRAGKVAGVLTLLLDALKGVVAVVVAKVILALPVFGEGLQGRLTAGNEYWWVAAAAIAVIVGHIFPIWLRFRGGKGVATSFGVFLVLMPIAAVSAGMIFVFVVGVTRYVSLASIVAAIAIPLLVLLLDGLVRPLESLLPTLCAAIAAAALIVFAHRENIRRLMAGTENEFK
jgi:glycerol-3-phosphate acyltransferase PlsY